MPKKSGKTGAESSSLVQDAPLTRVSRRRLQTRKRLLKAAYEVMSTQGVDGATIQEVTERADIGFGTFYSYFKSKDELAAQVLDCLINDLGRRNDLATRAWKGSDPARVQAFAARLTVREALSQPMWQWWAKRPDLLADRMQESFKPFGVRDIILATRAGVYRVDENDAESVWSQMVWMMVGGLRDVIVGKQPPTHERLIAELLMRVLGVSTEVAHEITTAPLPEYPPADIDFSYDVTLDPAMQV
ncbi:TetR/AcrR family transcriptional regulator [Holophaga foetida]|uniref:TetR/AcrR family transcriptional regulator n=1 Tax=Holophaga foetida TaxID=35839 RepID=UPI000247530F|nr:TetR/AcrR family transcriptional regulator [Holophaga foetida]